MQLPCAPEGIEALLAEARDLLKAEPPKAYLDLLQKHDGLVLNGLFIYASKKAQVVGSPDAYIQGFVEMNLISRDVDVKADFLVFGEDNMDEYVLQISTGTFQSRDQVPFETVQLFPTFEEMIKFAIEKNL